MKVLMINGSPRKRGNTQALLGAAAKEIKGRGIDVDQISLAELRVEPCTGCMACSDKPLICPIKDDGVKVFKRMLKADGLLFGSPVYFGGVTAQLKALFDRSIMVCQEEDLKDKVAGGVTVGGGAHGGQELALSQMITFFGLHAMRIAVSPIEILGAAGTGDKKGDVLNDKEGMASARSLGKRMADMLLEK